jgi:D-glutamate cyclase
MTADEKLAAILAAVQTDPGHRGLARDPHDNLFTATAGDFQAACWSIVDDTQSCLGVVTGFFIPSGDPPAFETDGPLGAVFLSRAAKHLRIPSPIATEPACREAITAGLISSGCEDRPVVELVRDDAPDLYAGYFELFNTIPTRYVFIEKVGPSLTTGRCLSMRGRDLTEYTRPAHLLVEEQAADSWQWDNERIPSIGIGDGGNEIGMGKISHETIVKNIPNGDLIHCRVPTDHLIVAGVSNWGAYALAAGIYVLRGVTQPPDLFDPDREREILEVMVREGPLVDGVTGKQTATVDGLTWEEYVKPLIRIREILES